jgi:hypothetical protein
MWKLKARTFSVNGELEKSLWDRLSKHDQEFNLEWNNLLDIAGDMSLPKLKKIIEFAEGL